MFLYVICIYELIPSFISYGDCSDGRNYVVIRGINLRMVITLEPKGNQGYFEGVTRGNFVRRF
jgi:hypothetical protein